MEAICNFLFFLVRPSFWLMNNPYCPSWDKRLNNILKEHEFEKITDCRYKLGDEVIWVENYPYACMRPYDIDIRPSRMTIYKAWKKFNQDRWGV